jgi:hypothetical protein
METEKKVFILGAGASSHFGYPLGNELIEAIDNLLEELTSREKEYRIKDDERKILDEAKNFVHAIKSYNPLNVDYFLSTHPKFEPIGKRLIEHVILRSQNNDAFINNFSAVKWWRRDAPVIHRNFESGNWVKFIHQSIVANCRNSIDVIYALKSIHIITFNYDLSFEQALYRYFETSTFFTEDHDEVLKKFLLEDFFKNNVIHVYGKINSSPNNIIPYSKQDFYESFQNWDLKDSKIKIIAIGKSKKNDDAMNIINECAFVYFLGYGFDGFNNKVLNLNEVFAKKKIKRQIYYTNVGDGIKVNDMIREYCGNNFDDINSYRSLTHLTQYTQAITLTKSTKKVYAALEEDFIIPVYTISE